MDDWYNDRLSDGGPVYTETNLDLLIVEPWNAFSSIVMMIPAIIWAVKLYPNYRSHLFLTIMLPLGFLGGLGSTIFHATRSHQFFLFMDVLPSAILTFSLTIYLWLRVLKQWWYIFFVLVLSIGIRLLVYYLNVSDHNAINISYATTGFFIGIPLIYLLIVTHYFRLTDVIIAITTFSLALLFRELDAYEQSFLSMGTHFLWHLLSAIGTYYVFSYLYFIKKIPEK